jgi:hypothetical protein
MTGEVDLLGHPIAVFPGKAEKRAEHCHYVFIAVGIVVPEDHMVMGQSAGLWLGFGSGFRLLIGVDLGHFGTSLIRNGQKKNNEDNLRGLFTLPL